ncbi:MAG: hypothetical protein HYY55_00975 [Candidatus Niyogibacteria bacterium]|nr:MAG: hypothetical protein HYY55_00975 [Candidatus Niyogibacteria bacterium]
MINNKKPRCFHPGRTVAVGPYSVIAGARYDMAGTDLSDVDILVSLTETVPARLWRMGYKNPIVWSFPIKDYYGPDGPWLALLEKITDELKIGKKIFIFCDGGHGRTGLLLASLIAKVESPDDPIAVTRSRYCVKAVETIQQAKTIFGLLGVEVPKAYQKTLMDANKIYEILLRKFIKKN